MNLTDERFVFKQSRKLCDLNFEENEVNRLNYLIGYCECQEQQHFYTFK